MDKVKQFSAWLKDGTWSRKQHKIEYHDSKFNRDIDIFVDYISQIPYLKLIGSPIVFLILLIYWSPVLLYVLRDVVIDFFKNKLGRKK